MFIDSDFDVFTDPTLAGRLSKIRAVIDPKFSEFGVQAVTLLNTGQQDWYAHVAKHARRTVYPPDVTWMGIAPNKRGYKMMPHFQLGMWHDCIFIYLAVLEDAKAKTPELVQKMQAISADITALPSDFQITGNHMEETIVPLNPTNLEHLLTLFATRKHSELLVGRVIKRTDALIGTEQLNTLLLETLRTLIPIYEKIR
ncbi:DUF1054 family protein [Periweissella cryptocerci]|uniref:DUF1054 family protein n=1 Tax=Periweissella cryptocerci TaxID=2506420 RepID=A0A4P6YVL8_9LACO|nr:DUF1054 family protein [Periweissella cryptocerci]QBO36821.1 DUF1054 family protein [Periweissella cryptocerci]